MGSFDIASLGSASHLASNVNSNELGIQPHTYFNLYLGHSYTSGGRTWNNDDRTMLIDSLKHVQLFGDLTATADEPAISILNTGTAANDTTKLNYKDKWGQIHAQLRTQLKDDSNGGTYDSAFHIRTAVNGTLATRIAIEEDGNVGIGTDAPGAPLHIYSANTGAGLLRIHNSGGGTGDVNGIDFYNYTNEAAVTNPQSYIRTEVVSSWGSKMHFGVSPDGAATTAATTKMTLDDTGNVGIGTSGNSVGGAPGSTTGLLNLYKTGTMSGSWLQQMRADSSTGNGLFVRAGVTSSYYTAYLTGYDENNVHLVVRGDGNVGIGTAIPDRTLHIYNSSQAEIKLNTSGASDGGLIYYNDSETQFLMRAQETDGNITFQTGGTTERMRITSAGNVGIGETSPSYKLEVAGTFYASGSSQAFKKDVTDLAIDSSSIYNLNPKSYNYKKDYENFGYDLAEGKQFGLISEEVAEAVPELAIMKDGEPKNVDYQKLSVLLLAEMQKMNKRIEDLECHI
jgi:hypothetical protein